MRITSLRIALLWAAVPDVAVVESHLRADQSPVPGQ